jgi:hypothetical protein
MKSLKKRSRAVIYTRVSTAVQAQEGSSLSEKLAACQRKIKDP